MDEVFWSNVVKRWSDASENVILLKKELAKVQEERTLYRNVLDGLRQPEVREPGRDSDNCREEHGHWIQDDAHSDGDGNLRDELKDAETGLRRAKEEYRKMQHDLAASAKRIKELTEENERLALNHRLEIEKQRDIYERILCSSPQKRVLRPETTSKYISTPTPIGVALPQMAETLRELSQQSDNSDAKVITASSPTLVAARPLENQIETLKQLTEEREADNQGLRQELAITREKLQKSEESKKFLLASIVKLQDIARHSSHGALHPLSSNLLQQFQTERLSEKYAISSRSSSRVRNADVIANPNPIPLGSVNGVESRNLGEQTSVEDTQSTSLVPSSYLPPDREKSIARLPFSTVNVDNTHNMFDREFLKTALGGEGIQSLIHRLPENQTSADKKTMSRSYLCPTLNHHPWCPSVPGQHGFIFVGLGKDKESYKSPVFRNLFVGLPKSQSTGRIFRYLGKYRVHRVKHLTVEEWGSLSTDVKCMYAKLTKDKAKDPRSLDDIIAAYHNGELFVPCVQLQYVSFDDALFATLISQRPATRTNT
ncbi:hypothetical protein M413DRAFT_439797 [Hebeloma cylindrosporum]|uniref:DUF6697 domain-containing protein n=1 Tax=Hebeloma cylindrosporum TaxID=76867 RepID=A0A0C2YEC2_HEBCY|nr:hypothetical protein M413DRAFT_439797 [Hebeloma cylindrosporum h7]